jgi:hypothetical protein
MDYKKTGHFLGKAGLSTKKAGHFKNRFFKNICIMQY